MGDVTLRLAATYERAALALERSANLADVHAAVALERGRPQEAARERAAAERARKAARLGHARAEGVAPGPVR